MDVTAEHEVYSGFVEDWDKVFADCRLTIPSVIVRVHMAEDDSCLRIDEFFTFDDLFEPLSFLFYIIFSDHDAEIADIRVVLVFSSVENKEEMISIIV